MGTLQKSFFAAVMGLTAVAPALAQEAQLQTSTMSPVSVMGHTQQNFMLYDMGEQVLSRYDTRHNHALVNKVIGLTCEWMESGRRVADDQAKFHTVGITAESKGCVTSVDIPEKWNSVVPQETMSAQELAQFYVSQGMPADISQVRATQEMENYKNAIGTVSKNASDPSRVREMIRPRDKHGLAGLIIIHDWNLLSQEVCMKTLNIPPASDHAAVTESLNWGCYAVKDKDYMNRVAEEAGFRMG